VLPTSVADAKIDTSCSSADSVIPKVRLGLWGLFSAW
jgi:histone-binding protein RBBP4